MDEAMPGTSKPDATLADVVDHIDFTRTRVKVVAEEAKKIRKSMDAVAVQLEEVVGELRAVNSVLTEVKSGIQKTLKLTELQMMGKARAGQAVWEAWKKVLMEGQGGDDNE